MHAGPERQRPPAERAREEGGDDPLSEYLPIRDYALIGDCHGCALVSRSGRIDWCAFGRFDADPVFCRILDANKGGFTSVAPSDSYETDRCYIDDTNILQTTFHTSAGSVRLVDFMPLGRRPGAGVHDYVSVDAPGLLIRVIEGLTGSVRLRLEFRPSADYGRAPVQLSVTPNGAVATDGATLLTEIPVTIDGGVAQARWEVRAGQSCYLVFSPAPLPHGIAGDRVKEMLQVTRAFWGEWVAYCRYKGPYSAIVRRSALTLKLLTYAPTGAIVAAATTSLPEEIGGERNWDYRFCWLRDATLTLYALAVLGYSGEGRAFSRFVELVCRKRPGVLQIMYAIDGEADLPETELDGLAGYANSRPVRAGNAAHKQHQADVYGELLDWSHLITTLGAKLSRGELQMIDRLVAFVADHAREPDQGLWEARGAPRHYVHGKIMSWVGLDRGLRLLGENARWRELRDRLLEEILELGVDPAGGYLRQAYHHAGTDAAVLLAPMMGLPLSRELLERTVAAVEKELKHGPFVDRYQAEDGLRGREGAFLICSFWLVDAYLALGRVNEATDLFEELIAQANDVGLFSEEIDAATGAFLGNFPQAFTHLALIGSAIHLELVTKHESVGIAGTYSDRAQRAVGATFGWKAIWEACKASGRVGRLWSSRRSIMPPALMGIRGNRL